MGRNRERLCASVFHDLKEELARVKEIEPNYISMSALLEFCCRFPYSLGDIKIALDSLDETSVKRSAIVKGLYSKNFELVAEIMKEFLDRKNENKFDLNKALRYIRNHNGNNVAGKLIKEIRDKLAELEVEVSTN